MRNASQLLGLMTVLLLSGCSVQPAAPQAAKARTLPDIEAVGRCLQWTAFALRLFGTPIQTHE